MFPGEGGKKPMDPSPVVKRHFLPAIKAAKVPRIRFHDLRHTFNTNMRKAGVPESVIMQVTGHATREMFDRYNTIDPEDTRLAINKFENFLNAYKTLTIRTKTEVTKKEEME